MIPTEGVTEANEHVKQARKCTGERCRKMKRNEFNEAAEAVISLCPTHTQYVLTDSSCQLKEHID